MKKFESLGRSLSKQEQKGIMGGNVKAYTCNATATQGYHVESPGSCSGELSWCQSQCDSWCTAANHCSSCTCS